MASVIYMDCMDLQMNFFSFSQNMKMVKISHKKLKKIKKVYKVYINRYINVYKLICLKFIWKQKIQVLL